MRWTTRIALPCVLVVALGACSAGLNQAGDDLLGGDDGMPGFEARDAAIVETGPDGAPRYRVSAEVITQDPANRVVQFETVQVRIEEDSEARWDIAARKGVMPAEGDAIELQGEVRIRGTPAGARAPIEIRGEQVRYEFASAVARSGSEVTILYSGQQLSARGLEARLKEQRVRLESDVHGRFTP